MEITIATCMDCGIDWELRCPLCKKQGWQVRKVKRKSKRKQNRAHLQKPKPIVKPIVHLKTEYDLLVDYFAAKHPKRVVTLIRQKHDAACACCYTLDNLTFDHIVPLSKGGVNSSKNGQILCLECNQLKNDRIIEIVDLRKELLIFNR